MEQIKTFEEACAALGISTSLPDFSALPEDMRAAAEAHYKLMIIARALNGDWKPDWNDDEQYKWYPWFYMGSAGAGFRFHDCACGCGVSYVGSRLAYKDEDTAEYAGKQFIELYRQYFVVV